MFKPNISPFNVNKDKYTHNHSQTNHNNLNYPSNNYINQIKNTYQNNQISQNTVFNQQNHIIINNVNNGKGDFHYNQVPLSPISPLGPLSPNLIKNGGPISPTSKIKMFSNTLNVNKKNQPLTPNDQSKVNQITAKYQQNYQTQNNEAFDLRCNQVLEEMSYEHNMQKLTKNSQNLNNTNNVNNVNNANNANKKLRYPLMLNLQQDIKDDDLKCDEVLDFQQFQHCKQKNTQLFSKLFQHHSKPSSELIKKQSNHTYETQNNYQNNNNKISQRNQNHVNNDQHYQNNHQNYQNNDRLLLTPREQTQNYHLNKNNSFLIRKNLETQRQYKDSHNNSKGNNSNNSNKSNLTTNNNHNNTSNINIEKLKSFSTHSASMTNLNKNKNFLQQKNKNPCENQQSDQDYLNLKSQQKTIQQMRILLERTSKLLQSYKRKFQEVNQKNIFLQKENVQLRRMVEHEQPMTFNQNYHKMSNMSNLNNMSNK